MLRYSDVAGSNAEGSDRLPSYVDQISPRLLVVGGVGNYNFVVCFTDNVL
jgi:hypothetical protein